MAGRKRLKREARLILNLDLQENDTPSQDTVLGPERPLLVKEPGSGDGELRPLTETQLIQHRARKAGGWRECGKGRDKGLPADSYNGFLFLFLLFQIINEIPPFKKKKKTTWKPQCVKPKG